MGRNMAAINHPFRVFQSMGNGYDIDVDATMTAFPNIEPGIPARKHTRLAVPGVEARAAIRPEVDWAFDFSFAFQPIVDVRSRDIVSYEALVRGPQGEPSRTVLDKVRLMDFPRFDSACHRRAIALAAQLRLPAKLNLNLAARNIAELQHVMTATHQACLECGFPMENIIVELVETGSQAGQAYLLQALRIVQALGFSTAIDDFGSGYSGLQLLVDHQPHYIKVDRHLIGGIQQDVVRQRIFLGFWRICNSLAIHVVAEGVEQAGEYLWLQEAGVRYFQGNYFASPAFEKLPEVSHRVYCG